MTSGEQPLLIGLVGGVASGKSAVAKMLAQLGAAVICADELAHRELAATDIVALLVERWGAGVLDSDGQIDRRKVADRVFASDDTSRNERLWLESLIHPRVKAAMHTQIDKATHDGHRVVVIDVPLLIEAGWRQECRLVVWIDAPLALRQQLAARRGWSSDDLAQREAAQLPMAEKQSHATHRIDNSGTVDELGRRVHQFWAEAVVPLL